jgi:cyclic-di-GMP-binding protein
MNGVGGIRIDTRLAGECRRYIAGLPITNVAAAHQALSELLQAMHRSPPSAVEYLGVLESARESLAFVQEAMAARYAAKPLPATGEEASAFERTVELWRLMANNYARVAQLGGNDQAIQQQLALVCQRCIYYAGHAVVEHFRARHTISAGFWLDLHGYYDTAEDWGLAEEPVADPLDEEGATVTGATTYATALLVDLSNPFSRSPRELVLILRWARKMAAFTAVRRPDDNAGGRGYGLDLMQDHGLLPVDHLAATPSARLFHTEPLADRMQRLLSDLKVGQSAASLGLGDCLPGQASRLLLQLYRPWCLAAMPRRFVRSQASGALSVAYEFDAIHYHIAGREFSQPEHVRSFSRSEVESMVTFGSMVESAKPVSLQTERREHALDTWDIADQSTYGFRVFRHQSGPRIEHGQLLALKTTEAKRFVLGRVTWLVLEQDGRLQAGIQVLPHPVAGVSVRPTGLGVAPTDKYSRGFFLPAVPAQKEPVSVVLPGGWFTPGRIIEVFTDRQVKVKLVGLMMQGANFDRCTFALAS